MTSLPTISFVFNPQEEQNNQQATVLFTALFPDIAPEIIYETFNIVAYLQTTRVNPQIIPRLIRGIHNVMIGSGRGEVVAHVRGPMTNVTTTETEPPAKTLTETVE